jgi:hypothetical protein
VTLTDGRDPGARADTKHSVAAGHLSLPTTVSDLQQPEKPVSVHFFQEK